MAETVLSLRTQSLPGPEPIRTFHWSNTSGGPTRGTSLKVGRVTASVPALPTTTVAPGLSHFGHSRLYSGAAVSYTKTCKKNLCVQHVDQEKHLDATERLRALFAPDGPLKAYFPRFQLREDQLNLALNIMAQLRSGSGQLVVEAGTGTGKSLAYLAAAYCAEKRVLISTGTLALQDQLFQKDLPDFFAALSAAGEQPPNVVLMKGRSNYLCQHRLATHAPGLPLMEEGGVDEMAQLISWSEVTDTGDKAEAPFMSGPFCGGNSTHVQRLLGQEVP